MRKRTPTSIVTILELSHKKNILEQVQDNRYKSKICDQLFVFAWVEKFGVFKNIYYTSFYKI